MSAAEEQSSEEARAVLRAIGARIRAEVLGAEYAAESAARHTAYAAPLLEYSMETGWGLTWDRPGLTRVERSLVTLAAMLAVGRSGEVRVHVRGALRNGVTPIQIREVLVQIATYCGIAAAAEGMATVQSTFADLGVDPDA